MGWKNLSIRQKIIRKLSLEVLNQARQSKQSLSKIAKKHHISIKSVINNTDAFRKVRNRWIPKISDKISRIIKINEDGIEKSIEVNDSEIASLIGRYHNAVKQFLNTGKQDLLQEFKYKTIDDANGNIHRFETDPQKLIEINQRIEEPEFYEIYGDEN